MAGVYRVRSGERERPSGGGGRCVVDVHRRSRRDRLRHLRLRQAGHLSDPRHDQKDQPESGRFVRSLRRFSPQAAPKSLNAAAAANRALRKAIRATFQTVPECLDHLVLGRNGPDPSRHFGAVDPRATSPGWRHACEHGERPAVPPRSRSWHPPLVTTLDAGPRVFLRQPRKQYARTGRTGHSLAQTTE